jgi:hypothetical protein
MALALAMIACLGSGHMVVALGWPRRAQSGDEWLLRASLSSGFGVGIFSVVFFLALILGFTRLISIDLVVLGLLAAASIMLGVRSGPTGIRTLAEEAIKLPRWSRGVLTASLVFALSAALYSSVLHCIVHPHGEGWDAFAIWNLHARFLFRGGAHWRDGLSPLIPWSHPDYPLLLPSAIAHFWTVLGRETTAVPAVIGLGFALATLGILYSSLAILRGRSLAMMGCLALASTPFFIEQASAQYADIPLSFFFLAAMSLLQRDGECRTCEPGFNSNGLLVLAGIATGFALWTKNEGMMFLVATVLAQLIVRGPRWRPRVTIFLAAVAPFFLFVTWFKHSVAFPNELFSNQPNLLHKILAPARYWTILQWFFKDFLRFGQWWLVPGTLVCLVLYFVMTGTRNFKNSQQLRTSALTLALTLAGYFAVYMITPYDLHWHLRFSLNRLFLQLWPCALFLFFLAIPRKVAEKSQNGTEFAQK